MAGVGDTGKTVALGTPTWLAIDAAIRKAARARRFSAWGLSDSDIDDICQLTALALIEAAAKRPELSTMLRNGGRRDAVVFAWYTNKAREFVRRRARRRCAEGRASHLADAAQPWNSELADLAPDQRDEGIELALGVFLGQISLKQYAGLRGTSIRTAQRRMALGIAKLRSIQSWDRY